MLILVSCYDKFFLYVLISRNLITFKFLKLNAKFLNTKMMNTEIY